MLPNAKLMMIHTGIKTSATCSWMEKFLMSNEDGRVWLVFNGMIYNYRSLQEELMRAGPVFLLVGGSLLLSATPAQAYLDPGSGSMLLQLLLGGMGGAAVIMKLYWRRFRAFFGRKKEAPVTADEPDAALKLDQNGNR